MNVLSLFSGVGGFDLGLEHSGMKTIYQCEWDKHATSILEKHWPETPRWGDISTLTGKEILRHGQFPDVVAWGSPCQDLSVAGGRKGLEGERSGLFHEGIRIIKELRKETNNEFPRFSIWENVSGALNSNGGADFGVIINEMAEAGALVIEWSMLDAQHFGIPQRRRRVFVIAVFNPSDAERCPTPLLPVTESVHRNTKKGKQKGQGAAGTVAESFGANRESTDSERVAPKRLLGSEIIGSLTASDYKWPQNQQLDDNKFVVEPFVKSRRAQSSEDFETWVPAKVNPTLNSFDVGDTRATTAIVEPMLLDGTRVNDIRVYQSPVQTLQERMGTGGGNVPMLAFDTQFGSNANVTEEVSPTLKSSQQSPSVAYEEESAMTVRRLTPVECERLMGWPDNHTRWRSDGKEQTDGHRYKQCGNGVASPVAKWVGEQLMKLESE
jgi:DNA (cytosine-5)-methyltransferase 1